MRKLFISLILVAVLVVPLSGCGSKSSPASKTLDKIEASEKNEVSENPVADDVQNNLDQAQNVLDNAFRDAIEESRDALEEDIEQQNAEMENEIVNADTIIIPNNTIYDKDGILITLDSISSLGAVITVKNDNPDNKKISRISMDFVGLNGISSPKFDLSLSDISVGESGTFEIGFDNLRFDKSFVLISDDIMDSDEYVSLVDKMKETYDKLGAKDIPIETVNFDFELRLGENDTVVEQIHSSVYTDKYKEGDLQSYYGDLEETIEFGPDLISGVTPGSCEIYVNTDMAQDNMYSILFTGLYDIGKDYNFLDAYLYLNDREIRFNRFPNVRGRDFIDVFTLELDPVEIRKDYELSNSDPINMSFTIDVGGKHPTYAIGTLPPL